MEISEPEDFERSEDSPKRITMMMSCRLLSLDHQIADPEVGDLVDGVDMLDKEHGPRSGFTLQQEAKSIL
eukprot:1228229-Amphidinium_carterae.7